MPNRTIVLGFVAALIMACLAACQQISLECASEAYCMVNRSPQDRGGNSGEVAASTGVGASVPGAATTSGAGR